MQKFNSTISLSVLTLLSAFISACGGGSGDSPARESNQQPGLDGSFAQVEPPTTGEPASCSVNAVNQWVYSAMQDYYLFYDQVERDVDITQFPSPEELMRYLRVQPNDRYSYVTDTQTYNAFFDEGESFGFGWNFARDADNAWLFSLIEPNSPLAVAGVQRGEQLLAINGIDMSAFTRLSTAERLAIIGEGREVTTLELTIGSQSAPDRQVTVTKATYALQTVLDTRVIEHDGVRVGYLHFYQFVNTSSDELQQAFRLLDSAGVTELVLDLRFNGGGRINVANELASRIVGDAHTDDVFTTFAYNDKYQAKNISLNFQAIPDSLSLNRIFVLQSANTCSASELVVNGLRPFMEVITVGTTSCGKPYATTPNTACDKVANALEIELLNAAGVGDYFEGIPADCAVAEDVRRLLGDPGEPLLGTALSYIRNGSCGILASRSRPVEHRLSNEFRELWQGGNSL